MEILRYGHDAYQQIIVDGASWQLLPIAFWTGIAVIVVHLICVPFRGEARADATTAVESDPVLRHARIDRWFHWITAASTAALLITGLFPILGIRFRWLEVHWISGLLLTLVVLLHVVRAATAQGLRSMHLRVRDLEELSGARPGKYSLAQKLMHLAWSVAVLVTIGTGIVLMVKAGTPLFERDPYLLTLGTWGILTLLHDLAALLAVFLILVHVYFGLLPEKRLYLRAMVRGWITRSELATHHDPDKVARGE